MHKKLTITVDEDIYNGLHRVIGRRKISRFLSDLARPHVIDEALDDAYRSMGEDEDRENEALEWSESLIIDVADGR